ncbi:tetratricopeptide repeat protein [Nocardiopsis alba]|uniref:tetratricopeptide repeat protein n=1 Tax=Nocardiopsis alba TaxID=53437 RepID=UPI00366B8CCE
MSGEDTFSQVPTAHIDMRWIVAGGDVIGQVVNLPRPLPTALFSLPPPPDRLVGRVADLEALLGELAPAPEDGMRTDLPQGENASSGVVVSALAGMGGVGKTALALAAGAIAHHKGWFCAELFVDLRGYTPGSEPLSAHMALDVLLRQMGVDPEDIPVGETERSSFYRSALAALERADDRGRPVLVVADNANTAAQVKPLLPGPGGHKLVATSRGGLHSLVGARHVDLDVLDLDGALALLAAELTSHTPEDPRAEDEVGLGRLIELCGRLPLALEIAAAYLKRNPRLTPDRMADRLEKAASRVDKLADPDRGIGKERALRAVFDTSLEHLDRGGREVFLLVASTPGPTLGTAAAAVLTDLPFEEVEEVLEELAAAHLLTQPAAGRWGVHDLLADYARHHPDPPAERDQALGRLLDGYTAVVRAADQHLQALPGQSTSDLFPDRETASGWLDVERATLVAAALAAPGLGHAGAAMVLPLCLGFYLGRGRHFEDLEQVSRSAQRVAHTVGDAYSEAGVWTNIGVVLRRTRRFDEAIDAYIHACDLYHQVGEARGEAQAWNNLGLVLVDLRRFDEAIRAHFRACEVFEQAGDAHGEAGAWNNLGAVLRQVRRFDEAIGAHFRAHEVFQRVGDAHGEAQAWNNLGSALIDLRRFDEAVGVLSRACEVFRQVGDAHSEAQAWNNLGAVLKQLDRFDEAIDALSRACEVFHHAGDAHSEARAWTNLGAVLVDVSRFDEAIQAHTRAREVFQQVGDVHSEAVAWNNLGVALADLGRFDEAIDAHTRACDLYHRTGDTHGEAGAWRNLGAALTPGGVRRAEAVEAMRRSVDLYETSGDEHRMLRVQEWLARIQQEPDADGST